MYDLLGVWVEKPREEAIGFWLRPWQTDVPIELSEMIGPNDKTYYEWYNPNAFFDYMDSEFEPVYIPVREITDETLNDLGWLLLKDKLFQTASRQTLRVSNIEDGFIAIVRVHC